MLLQGTSLRSSHEQPVLSSPMTQDAKNALCVSWFESFGSKTMRKKVWLLVLTVTGGVFVTFWMNRPPSLIPLGPDDPNAADLVRAVRKSEVWLGEVNSLLIEANRTWSASEAGIGHFKKEINAEFAIEEPNETQFPWIRSSYQERLVLACDREHFKSLLDFPNYWRREANWDGSQLRRYDMHRPRQKDVYTLTNEHAGTFHNAIVGDFGWLWSQDLHWQWAKPQTDMERLDREEYLGRPSDFKCLGKADYRGVPCYVLQYCVQKLGQPTNQTREWYVGQTKLLLYGFKIYHDKILVSEHWTLDHQEVAPGAWFPMHTGWAFYDSNIAFFRKKYSWCDIKVEKVEVDQPLSDDMLIMPLKPNVDINDSTSGELRQYRLPDSHLD